MPPAKGEKHAKADKKKVKKDKADSDDSDDSDSDYGEGDEAGSIRNKAKVEASFDSIIVHLAAGTAFGGVAGYLDNTFSEPFGLIIGGSLLLMQLVDHEGMCSFFWNTRVKNGKARRSPHKLGLVEETKHFCCLNAYIGGGFAAGYLVGYKVVEMV